MSGLVGRSTSRDRAALKASGLAAYPALPGGIGARCR